MEAGATCLCITAGKTLMFDRDEMIARRQRRTRSQSSLFKHNEKGPMFYCAFLCLISWSCCFGGLAGFRIVGRRQVFLRDRLRVVVINPRLHCLVVLRYRARRSPFAS